MTANWDAVNPELEAQIIANPDEDALRGVYADWLIEARNPRGELAALQLADDRAAAKAFLDEHAIALYGEALEVDWKAGFWDGAVGFSEIVPHGSARLLRSLEVPVTDRDDFDRNVREIAAACPLALRTLVLGGWSEGQEAGEDWDRVCLELPLLSELPRLEDLTVRAGDFRVGDFRALRRFFADSMDLRPTALRSLYAATLPKLEELSFWISPLGIECQVSVDDFAPLLAGDLFPALRQVTVQCDPEVDSLRAELAQAAATSRLATRAKISVTR